MCWMFDGVENFEYIFGVYLLGRFGEFLVRKVEYFWEVYDKKIVFIYFFKFNYKYDGVLNVVFL